jgi:hypothetical protein
MIFEVAREQSCTKSKALRITNLEEEGEGRHVTM